MTKMDEIVKEPNEHTHVGDPVAVRRNVVLDTITQVASASHETTRYIIGDALQPETNDILMRLTKKSTLERSIQRHRNRKPPWRIQRTEISPYQNPWRIQGTEISPYQNGMLISFYTIVALPTHKV